MNTQDINALLEKYWEGDSSLTDEQALKSYFNRPNIATEHEEYQGLFNALNGSKEYTISQLNRETLLHLAQSIPVEPETKVIRFKWMQPLRIAAAIAFLMIAGWVVMDQMAAPQIDLQASTVETPEEALEQSRAALLYVSSILNKGVQASEELNHLKSINDVIPGSL